MSEIEKIKPQDREKKYLEESLAELIKKHDKLVQRLRILKSAKRKQDE